METATALFVAIVNLAIAAACLATIQADYLAARDLDALDRALCAARLQSYRPARVRLGNVLPSRPSRALAPIVATVRPAPALTIPPAPALPREYRALAPTMAAALPEPSRKPARSGRARKPDLAREPRPGRDAKGRFVAGGPARARDPKGRFIREVTAQARERARLRLIA